MTIILIANHKSRALLLQLDLLAVFETKDQEILISKLEINFGIYRYALQWLHSYLSDRAQFVMICWLP